MINMNKVRQGIEWGVSHCEKLEYSHRSLHNNKPMLNKKGC